MIAVLNHMVIGQQNEKNYYLLGALRIYSPQLKEVTYQLIKQGKSVSE